MLTEILGADVSPRSVAFTVRPEALDNARMLVVHRTGVGKTATMIQICDSYFLDRRPKICIFPTTAVCNSFYRELRMERFPNRYSRYLDATGLSDARKGLELQGILRHGRVADEYLAHDEYPSAPLRAFSYTQGGGSASCGQHVNACFKCPDGYAGPFGSRAPRNGGYADFAPLPAGRAPNPFSNKIILMDEVHNLVRPSADILRTPRRLQMLIK